MGINHSYLKGFSVSLFNLLLTVFNQVVLKFLILLTPAPSVCVWGGQLRHPTKHVFY